MLALGVLGHYKIIEQPIHPGELLSHRHNCNEICEQKTFTKELYSTLESGKKENSMQAREINMVDK